MISFKKYTDVVGGISKKLKVSKDVAVNALIKAQEKGMNPLKWQSNLAMLQSYIQIVTEYDPTIDERMMTDRQKLVQIQHYWDNLDHMASDETKKKSLERLGYKNIKVDSRGKITSFDEDFDEAKQGHALVVGGKVVARGSKKQLLKQIKKDKIKIDHKKNFLTFTGKEVGDSWDEERDYKDEYKKFQSSDKMRKYRAELNKYNREKGTYGNGDEKDASHKDGKIVGMEDQSINRGRAEKSRLIGSKRK